MIQKQVKSLQTVDAQTHLLGKGDVKTWYVTVKVIDEKTKQEKIGVSEAPFYENGKKDPNARAKAVLEAELNAKRKLIPQYLLTEIIRQIMNLHKSTKIYINQRKSTRK